MHHVGCMASPEPNVVRGRSTLHIPHRPLLYFNCTLTSTLPLSHLRPLLNIETFALMRCSLSQSSSFCPRKNKFPEIRSRLACGTSTRSRNCWYVKPKRF